MTIKPQEEAQRELLLQKAYKDGQDSQNADSAEAELEVRALYAEDPEALRAYERGRAAPPVEQRVHFGRVIEHGSAKYKFDPNESPNYYVELELDNKIEVVWGLDLKRALNKNNLKVGDLVKLKFMGKEPVRVEANIRNEKNEVIGKEWVTAERNTWGALPWDPDEEPAVSRRAEPDAQPPMSDAIFRPGAASVDGLQRMRPAPAARSLIGSMGASRLSNMLEVGGRCVRTNIADFAYKRATADFDSAVRDVGAHLSQLGALELSGLKDPLLDEAAKDQLVESYFSKAENLADYERLLTKFDRVQTLSEKVISNGLEKGMDGDALLQQAIAPIHRLMTDHEKLLRGLNQGSGSLYDQVENAVSNLFKKLRELLTQAAGLFCAERSQGPGTRLGS
ncbi:hypothetical protein [Pseudomonas cannabina]|nr:hypothetical protein [Pseudomonas cannabina]